MEHLSNFYSPILAKTLCQLVNTDYFCAIKLKRIIKRINMATETYTGFRRYDRSFREQVDCLEIGESVSFPPHRLFSIKAMASEYGFTLGKKFKVKANKVFNAVEVTRVK